MGRPSAEFRPPPQPSPCPGEGASPTEPDVVVRIAVDAPQHSGLTGPLDYLSVSALAPGQLLRVPLGRRVVLGIVWPGPGGTSGLATKPVGEVFDSLPPKPPLGWRCWTLPPPTTSAASVNWRWPCCHQNCASSTG